MSVGISSIPLTSNILDRGTFTLESIFVTSSSAGSLTSKRYRSSLVDIFKNSSSELMVFALEVDVNSLSHLSNPSSKKYVSIPSLDIFFAMYFAWTPSLSTKTSFLSDVNPGNFFCIVLILLSRVSPYK